MKIIFIKSKIMIELEKVSYLCKNNCILIFFKFYIKIILIINYITLKFGLKPNIYLNLFLK